MESENWRLSVDSVMSLDKTNFVPREKTSSGLKHSERELTDCYDFTRWLPSCDLSLSKNNKKYVVILLVNSLST